MLAEAGCLSDEQHAEAITKVREYTVRSQTELQLAGYYKGKVDGIYGPDTVDAVKQLQTDSDLPATGFVDRATALALEAKVQSIGADAATQSLTQTAGGAISAGRWPATGPARSTASDREAHGCPQGIPETAGVSHRAAPSTPRP